MSTSELVKSLAHNETFINAIVCLGAIIVLIQFFSFIKSQYREGLTPHFTPCGQCGQRLAPSAYFCPECGNVFNADLLRVLSPSASASASSNGKQLGLASSAGRPKSRYMR